jgi:HSP20 family protein
MNGIFDDVFRGFDLAPFGSPGRLSGLGWPQIDIDETDKEVRISDAVLWPVRTAHTAEGHR